MDSKPKGLDSDRTRTVIKWMAAANVWIYRRTGGRIGSTWRVGAAFRKPVPIALVEHRGRKSGKLRTTPLVVMRDGDRLVVVASQAGRPEHPQWYFNVMAEPRVTAQLGRDRGEYLAHEADETERAQLWPKLVELYADYASYQSWTDRVIPVIVLEPI